MVDDDGGKFCYFEEVAADIHRLSGFTKPGSPHELGELEGRHCCGLWGKDCQQWVAV